MHCLEVIIRRNASHTPPAPTPKWVGEFTGLGGVVMSFVGTNSVTTFGPPITHTPKEQFVSK